MGIMPSAADWNTPTDEKDAAIKHLSDDLPDDDLEQLLKEFSDKSPDALEAVNKQVPDENSSPGLSPSRASPKHERPAKIETVSNQLPDVDLSFDDLPPIRKPAENPIPEASPQRQQQQQGALDGAGSEPPRSSLQAGALAAKDKIAGVLAALRRGDGELIWKDCGAEVRKWREPEDVTTVFLLDSGSSPSGLIATFKWTLTNVLLQDSFPDPPTADIVTAASGGGEYVRERVYEVQPGHDRVLVLPRNDSKRECSLAHVYQFGAEPCLQCKVPVGLSIPGRFSGEYFEVAAGKPGGPGKVHSECHEAFRERHAKKCLLCSGLILAVPDRFSGKFFEYSAGQLGDHAAGSVHSECNAGWKRRWAPKCLQCSGPVMVVEGTFSGEFFPYEAQQMGAHEAGEVHAECHDAWLLRWAKRCLHCKEPILKVDGKFSGLWVTYQAFDGRVHEECSDAFQAACGPNPGGGGGGGGGG
eukprot:CAMPEP_0115197424 /NCGR_PEP_ID=MMETSP0270-20121206/15588_1 /TAXON_ID=71861 /ORGANISM="Scrippsiella trochoidea, Strain CCMP3099" /LENGTH=470 /DNA_ID=CAMNT_0002610775 /DNA_START=1 /DNA_END=1411 /DNA_ORIENTATION=+